MYLSFIFAHSHIPLDLHEGIICIPDMTAKPFESRTYRMKE